MKKITSRELRKLFFLFFQNKDHKLISSASLIPENDSTVLFTTAGMHPLVPYLLGEKHPQGKKLCNVQKCIRTSDIDEVGDTGHLTFFEMLGNWSLGDYFKKDAIKFSYEFLTSEKYLGIPQEKLYFTCFAGDDEIPKDEVSYNVWKSLGVADDHIFYLAKKDNFWILGSGVGPCGPDTEIFYDTGKEKCHDNCNPSCDCGKFLEIWNNVFMEYYAHSDKALTKLKQQNVDTGMGLERTVAVLNGFDSVYEIDVFENLKKKIEELSTKNYQDNLKEFRIVMDHIRAAIFILGDDYGVIPTNVGSGYVLRRLIRRAIRNLKNLGINHEGVTELAKIVIDEYKDIYPELTKNKKFILAELLKEGIKFSKTLKNGEKLFYKVVKNLQGNTIKGEDAFKLFDTFGFPLEMTIELAKENNLLVDEKGFQEQFKIHQEKSRTIDIGSAKGGLADQSYESIKYHTLAHLLLAALQEKYGPGIVQKGCNINPERIRFDFNLDHKFTEEEKIWLTKRVNEMIQTKTDVTVEKMTCSQAKKRGAHGNFYGRYEDIVKVYTIGKLSQEICGGPHVKNTAELGTFKIIKEESCAAGIRRIKGILE